MSQYRQKPTYGFIILAGAVFGAVGVSAYLRNGSTYAAALTAIIVVLWVAYGIWALRMTYLRIEPSGLTVRMGGLIGVAKFVAWGDISSATLDGNRLELDSVDGTVTAVRLSSLRPGDREDFLRALSAHTPLSRAANKGIEQSATS